MTKGQIIEDFELQISEFRAENETLQKALGESHQEAEDLKAELLESENTNRQQAIEIEKLQKELDEKSDEIYELEQKAEGVANIMLFPFECLR